MTQRSSEAPTHDEDEPNAAEELAEGRAALAAGDRHEALMRAARALAKAPGEQSVLAAVDDIVRTVPDALDHTTLTDDVPFGIVALRARILAVRGQRVEAAALALQVAAFRPSLPYAEWAARWLGGERVDDADASGLVPRLGKLYANLPTPLDDGATRNARAALEILSAELSAHVAPDVVGFLRAGFLRRLGEMQQALAEARHAVSACPSWLSAVTLGEVLRDDGQVAAAIEAFRRATTLDDTDASAWLEIAELCAARGDADEKRRACREALKREPENRRARQLLAG